MRNANRVIAFLGVAAVCTMTSVKASAIDLSPGDLVINAWNKKLLRVDPVTGTQTVIYSGAFSRAASRSRWTATSSSQTRPWMAAPSSGSIARRAPVHRLLGRRVGPRAAPGHRPRPRRPDHCRRPWE